MTRYPSAIYEIEASQEVEMLWDDFNEALPARCDTCGVELSDKDIDKCEDYCIKCWNESERKHADQFEGYKPDYIK